MGRVTLIKNAVFLSCAFFITQNSLASDALNNTEDQSAEKTSNLGWRGYIATAYSDNWKNDYRDDRDVAFDLKVGYQLTNKFSMGVITGIDYRDTAYCSTHTKDYWCVSPTYIYAKYRNLTQFLDDFVKLGVQGRILLPTSQYAKDTKLHFAVKGYMPIAFDMERYIEGLSLSITPSVTKYFNKYKTSGGRNLTEYTISLALNTSYQLSEKLSLSFNLTDSNYITYQGNSTYPTISHSEELGYQATNNWYLGVGYSNSAQFYNPEQGSNPINGLFDDKDPYFYLTTSYSF